MDALKSHCMRISQFFLYFQCCVAVTTMVLFCMRNYLLYNQVITIGQFIDKIGIIILCLSLVEVNKKQNKPVINFIVAVSACFILFELYSVIKSDYYAYIWFLLLHTYADILCMFSGVSHKALTILHILTFIYHAARLAFKYLYNSDFPLFEAIMLYVNYTNLDCLNIWALKSYFKIIQDQENMIKDFNTIIDINPTPTIIFKCNAGNRKVMRKNQKAQEMFTETEIQEIAFKSQVIKKSVVSSFAYNNKELSLHSSPLKTTAFGESTYIISILDNTELVRKQKELAQENAKWLFVNSINHQIKTPLSCIESSLLLIESSFNDEKQKDAAGIQRYIKVAYHSIKDLRHIIDDSVLFCEDKGDSIESKEEKFKIEEICGDLINEFTIETYSKEIKYTVDQHIYPYVLIGDKKRIMHVLYTLTSNAFKYTTKGEVSLRHSLAVANNVGILTLIVRDSGIGICDEDKTLAFNTFVWTERSLKEAKTSTGISLYIAKRICIKMGGNLEIMSKVNNGTDIIMTIKLLIMKTEDDHIKLEKIMLSECETQNFRVLVVDDNVSNLFILKSMLTRLRIECDDAHQGLEAVNKYKAKHYQLILMDINMPVMNGYDAARVIKVAAKNYHRNLTIIAVSAQDEPKNESELSKCGIDYWVEKPLRMEMLKKILKLTINNTQSTKTNDSINTTLLE